MRNSLKKEVICALVQHLSHFMHFCIGTNKNPNLFVPMNKPYNIQNTNICNGIFHISFFKALLINEGETTQGERE
jgi:hypothetical protein